MPSPAAACCSRESGRLTAAVVGRRIAISYTSFAVGRGLMALAKERVLTPADTIYIVHVFMQRNEVGFLFLIGTAY